MSISISYSTSYATNTVAQYLSDWSAYFGDLNHREGSVKEGVNTGGFNPGPFDGTQYGVSSTASDAAVVAEGSLHYTLFNPPSHTLWGSLDSLTFGDTLAGGAASGGYTVASQEVSFTNLGLSSLQSEGRDGQVHKIVYGLMSGDSSALVSAIDALLKDIDPSLSVNSTFDQLAAAGVAHLDSAAVAASDVALVGVQDVPQDFALAA
ncbi:heme acquisition protein HasAp [Pseudomonas azotoformans]|uniref:Heme acquisition protein HasAp n=1 Tax=Pseudomonas azotoformans TaxID=47878 RepID=A0A1V2J6U6_PSEAZ|nr:heme acquisition protein HasA [Pseudomonas azotoformans]OIN50081.1 heme acquisition protein HasAp [Pseudomonas azotoformans]ONH40985.1 heme acquisition protein HasAp [Pseudomonas azotoformans]SDO05195.1 heme acquisition protein HasA [Pseudomonas azotoformans]